MACTWTMTAVFSLVYWNHPKTTNQSFLLNHQEKSPTRKLKLKPTMDSFSQSKHLFLSINNIVMHILMNSMWYQQFFPTKKRSKIWGPWVARGVRIANRQKTKPRSRDLCVSCICDSRPGQVGETVENIRSRLFRKSQPFWWWVFCCKWFLAKHVFFCLR